MLLFCKLKYIQFLRKTVCILLDTHITVTSLCRVLGSFHNRVINYLKVTKLRFFASPFPCALLPIVITEFHPLGELVLFEHLLK